MVLLKVLFIFYAIFLNNLLPTNTLMSELANEILVHLSGCKHLELEPKDCSLPEKELKTLQYFAGFRIHLYTKFRFSRNFSSAFHNQYCLILHACSQTKRKYSINQQHNIST